MNCFILVENSHHAQQQLLESQLPPGHDNISNRNHLCSLSSFQACSRLFTSIWSQPFVHERTNFDLRTQSLLHVRGNVEHRGNAEMPLLPQERPARSACGWPMESLDAGTKAHISFCKQPTRIT
jgi:hypothetical protein